MNRDETTVTPDRGAPVENKQVPGLPDLPPRAAQDTERVEGRDAMDLPEEMEETAQRPVIQG